MAGDIIDITPDAPTRARIEAEIASYNRDQKAILFQAAKRIALVYGAIAVAGAVAAAIATALEAHSDWFSRPHLMIYLLTGVAAWMAWSYASGPTRAVRQQLRNRTLPLLFGFLDKAGYSHGAAARSVSDLPHEVIGKHNSRTYGDCISGAFNGAAVEIFEATFKQKETYRGRSGYETREKVVFRGVLLSAELRSAFPGVLIAMRKTGDLTRMFRDAFGSDFETLDFEDPSIASTYEVRTTNPEAARTLMAGALSKALAFFRQDWPDGQPRLALKEGHGFVVLPTRRDFFELPTIGTMLDYRKHFEPHAAELARLAALAALIAKIG